MSKQARRMQVKRGVQPPKPQSKKRVNWNSPLTKFVLQNLSAPPSEIVTRFNDSHSPKVTVNQVAHTRSRLKQEGIPVVFARSTRTGGFSRIDPKTGEPLTISDRLRKFLLNNPLVNHAKLMEQVGASQPLIDKTKRQLRSAGILQKGVVGRPKKR